MGLHFSLIYRSDFDRHTFVKPEDLGRWGPFWWSPKYTAHFSDFGDEQVWTIQIANGNSIGFEKRGDEWVLIGPIDYWGNVDTGSAIRYRLKETSEYLYLMDPIAERVYIFEKFTTKVDTWVIKKGRIVGVLDRNGNQLTYTYGEADHNNPARIEDGLGRSLDFTYENLGTPEEHLSRVTDQAGRQVSFAFEYAADNGGKWTLRSVTDPMGHTTTFTYTTVQNPWLNFKHTDNIAAIQRPKGNIPYTQLYAVTVMSGTQAVRVTEQRDAYGNTTTLTYDTAQNQVTADRPDGSTAVYRHYSHHGLPKSLTDAAGNTITFTKNITEQVTAVTDRMGDTTSFTYHPETGKLASVTNNKGDTITHTYTAQAQTFTNPISPTETVTFTFYNLTRVDYPDGTNEQFAYDTRGNLTTYTDQAGQDWAYQYNARGQVTRITNPAGGTVNYTYNTDGTPASRTDSDTGTTVYGYDAYKRLNRITRPDSSFIQIAYNLNNQVTAITDENGNTRNYTYDVNGNLTQVTDPTGNSTRYAYDLMDRLLQISDRRSKNSTLLYNSMGRPASVTDPNNIQTTFGYDPRGWLDEITIGGRTWQIGYDEEGMIASETTPLGNTTTYEVDKLGYVTGITDPLGQTTTFTRDSMGRITEITDPLSRTTTYSYDSRGLLIGVTAPVIGTATYERNNLGLLGQITDLNGNSWTFSYTDMGRLRVSSDPLGNTWQESYDDRGRLSQRTYPGGETQTLTYDDASNVIRRQFSIGPDIQYNYDPQNRLTGANGVGLTLNEEGQVIATDNSGTLFGATYDNGGRLSTVTYNNGTFTVTYSYDPTTGLLSGVTDSLTGVQVDFSYDNDGRLTGIARPNGVNSTFAYDNADRLTRIQEGSIIDIRYALDGAGQVIAADMTVPLDPADLLTSATDRFTFDVASQVSSAGYSYDARGRLISSPGHTYEWDGASRLTGIDGVTLSYNGLGDLVTRTEGGTTIHYYYNYAIGLTPIVAERNDSTGQFLRYYVWTPDGSLLYMIDAADGNKVYYYHFDLSGSTLALTDGEGNVTDAYAYTPYGELLQHDGSNEQPFTFVGELGVRQEGAVDGLYQMRGRYYDATTSRFLSRETIWPIIYDPRQLNPYQYTHQNPVAYSDPLGLWPKIRVKPRIRRPLRIRRGVKFPNGAYVDDDANAGFFERGGRAILESIPGWEALYNIYVNRWEPPQGRVEYIAGEVAKDIYAAPFQAGEFFLETVRDFAWWYVGGREAPRKNASWWERMLFKMAKFTTESEIIYPGLIELNQKAQEGMKKIGEWTAHIAGKVGRQWGSDVGTYLYGSRKEKAELTRRIYSSNNPFTVAGRNVGAGLYDAYSTVRSGYSAYYKFMKQKVLDWLD